MKKSHNKISRIGSIHIDHPVCFIRIINPIIENVNSAFEILYKSLPYSALKMEKQCIKELLDKCKGAIKLQPFSTSAKQSRWCNFIAPQALIMALFSEFSLLCNISPSWARKCKMSIFQSTWDSTPTCHHGQNRIKKQKDFFYIFCIKYCRF